VRPERRRDSRTRRRNESANRDPRFAWQGHWRDGWLYRRIGSTDRFSPVLRARIHYTTPLPPALAAGALASVRHLRSSKIERDRHQERAATVRRRLLEAGLPVMPAESHIVPVVVGNPQRCKA